MKLFTTEDSTNKKSVPAYEIRHTDSDLYRFIPKYLYLDNMVAEALNKSDTAMRLFLSYVILPDEDEDDSDYYSDTDGFGISSVDLENKIVFVDEFAGLEKDSKIMNLEMNLSQAITPDNFWIPRRQVLLQTPEGDSQCNHLYGADIEPMAMGRGSIVRVKLADEITQNDWDVCFGFHKGSVFMWSEMHSTKDRFFSDPELPRD